jgi:hypothetical protein
LKNKFFLKKYLGENFEKDLVKSEVGAIVKPDANIPVLPQEMYIALQIIPRTVLSLLVQHLKPLKAGESKDIPWHLEDGRTHNLHINKISSDLYSGQITGEGKVLAKFGYRSLPAVGLVIMSTYELYDKETNKQDLQNPQINYDKVQQIIDERIRTQCLVEDVVNRKLSERDALHQLIMQKIQDYFRSSEAVKQSILTQDDHEEKAQKAQLFASEEESEESEEEPEENEENEEESEDDDISIGKEVMKEIKEKSEEKDSKSKKSKLKEFLDKKVKKTEGSVKIVQKQISCPDCSTVLYKGEDKFNLCLCYGEHYGKDIKIKKNKDNSYSFKFPKSFEMENIEMLLDTIKSSKK